MKIILYVAMSADGYIARKDGAVDWLDAYNDSGHDFGYKKFFESITTVIVGNTTQKQFPQKYEGKKCFVFSRNAEGTDENITYVSGDVKEFVEKHNIQGNAWLVGGADLVRQFLDYNLIDEFIITVTPDLLGDGIPLFTKSEVTKKLRLISSTAYGDLVQLHYQN